MSDLTPHEEYQPTIVSSSAVGVTPPGMTGGMSADVSQAKVGFVGGATPKFADETGDLLRQRLMAASLMFSVILVLALIGNQINGNAPYLLIRLVVLGLMIGSFFTLRSNTRFTLSRLRIFELIVFGSVAVQVMLMMYTRIDDFLAENDPLSVVAGLHGFMAAWSIIILGYGIFMPNDWKRAAIVLTPMVLAPYIVQALLGWQNDQLAVAMKADHMGSPVPFPVVAALMAIYGTHTINAVRREAFKARQLGQYHLKEKLGEGGMGEVYAAEHRMLKRKCAIKLIRPESDSDIVAISRFEREVQSTAKLSHWNTIEIFDYGRTDDGTFYYVMELLPGLSLDQLVRRFGPLPASRVIFLLLQACQALEEAHGVGLIHRDIKPANIFSASRGGSHDVVKLLDFGLVKTEQEEAGDNPLDSPTGGFSGSPLYMAPEQAADYEQADARCDIYALGAVAYFLLTGRPMFQGRNPIEILMAHARQPVVPPSQIIDSVPDDLQKVVMRCLEKRPEDRFQDVISLESALANCAASGDWNRDLANRWWKETLGSDIDYASIENDPDKTDHGIDATVDISNLPGKP